MNIVTFCQIDESLFNPDFSVEYFHSKGESKAKADIAILDIETIFEYEENKHDACKDKFVSIAVLEDDDDYEAFKNFGIDAWIRSEELAQINNLIIQLKDRFLS
ncbi:hypothetical protein AAX26_01476 [Aliarcobacter thereius]|uniref:Uncharacterized protein n=2 Tax=Aliarcobacter thereius TaxID=544718 RepID=A0A1C0B675_9BACT|nr:hypothetical protein [Aliarcobacter thereius]OCL86343.1 hypothetical protein AAX26_01476 [Aliarcobacter thereius]OCL90029.1 hypothetical protein AAX25_01783 [Aliarcobacter thereius]OCL96371.1 hypothetical protein AA347_01862 [Aliarcobacter thereius LMG 24486]OCL98668.1 hypothetical protein AAX29_01581 [Aliarcobacter thereius]QBF15667.1 hypothetical protein ATH_0594 [Aliarcobacter thereius LMG 24486]